MKTIIMTDTDTLRFKTINDLIQKRIDIQYAMKVLCLGRKKSSVFESVSEKKERKESSTKEEVSRVIAKLLTPSK